MANHWFSRDFGGVRLFWRLSAAGDSFGVRATWEGQEFLDATLSARHPNQTFSLDEEDGKVITAGEFRSRWSPSPELVVDLTYPGGEVRDELLYPGSGPPPPPPPPRPGPEAEAVAETVSAAPPEDLFPFLYLRPWPAPKPEQLGVRFVTYSADCAATPSSFFCQLAALRAEGERAAMEELAVAFVDGQAPWSGQFVRSPLILPGAISRFGLVDQELRAAGLVEIGELKAALTLATGLDWPAIVVYVTDPASSFPAELDRVWQSLFALTITLGYDLADLERLLATAVMASLVVRIATHDDPAAWPPWRVTAGVWASVVLPAAVFPLPPGDTPPAAAGWQVLYAAGDLNVVERSLVGYRLGEVRAIENVLQGEWKETTERRLDRRSEATETAARESSAREIRDSGTATDLLLATQETLARQFTATYSTTYGPPTEATASGSLAFGGTNGTQPVDDQATLAARFAREVARLSVERLAATVSTRRARQLLEESEQTVVRRFDARDRTSPVHGVYRWVHKVYGLQVVQRGHRLVLELSVPEPAAAFLRSRWVLAGVDLARPVSPVERGLTQATVVSTDPTSPLYWALLAAEYGALEVEPPPPATSLGAAAFEGPSLPAGALLPLAAGYEATTGTLTASWPAGTSETPTVSGVLGSAAFSLTPSAPTVTVPLTGETAAVPLAFTAAAASVTTGLPAPLPEPPFVLTATVAASLGPVELARWQVATYRALLVAYERKKAAFYAAAGIAPENDPLRARETEQRELRRQVAAQLLALAKALVGSGPPVGAGAEPTVWTAGEPRYGSFLESAFEWREMSYRFEVPTVDPRDASPRPPVPESFPGADSLFTAFLEASSARVLLPVRPGREAAVLYYLAAGQIWPGDPGLTPVHETSVPAANELKTLALAPPSPARGERWEVVVPTTLTWLDDRAALPLLSR